MDAALMLVLRDVHLLPAPAWWPPAPNWWWLAAAIAGLAIAWRIPRARRARRLRAAGRYFDNAMAAAASPAQALARASELLRRAARAVRPEADRLHGDAWLAFLDDGAGGFVDGAGRLLLDGPYRAEVPREEAEAALALARARFIALRVPR